MSCNTGVLAKPRAIFLLKTQLLRIRRAGSKMAGAAGPRPQGGSAAPRPGAGRQNGLRRLVTPSRRCGPGAAGRLLPHPSARATAGARN